MLAIRQSINWAHRPHVSILDDTAAGAATGREAGVQGPGRAPRRRQPRAAMGNLEQNQKIYIKHMIQASSIAQYKQKIHTQTQRRIANVTFLTKFMSNYYEIIESFKRLVTNFDALQNLVPKLTLITYNVEQGV
jgi:hypothetical protein